jgi:cytochrome c oxidase cbb3-type subunit I/II
MPAWGISTDEDVIWLIATYENSFQYGAVRTIDGGISDSEGDDFDALHHPLPQIAGTETDFQKGGSLYNMYCAQCHGSTGLGDGPASIASTGGYIDPQPANFEESGKDFTNYGRWVWKVREGVETTNMPPWMFAFSDEEIYQVIFYIQTFSTADDYNTKWAPLYTDSFARNFKR